MRSHRRPPSPAAERPRAPGDDIAVAIRGDAGDRPLEHRLSLDRRVIMNARTAITAL
jgi:hypothetical protein